MSYQERDYRLHCRPAGLVSFTARVRETDLWCLAERDLGDEAVQAILNARRGLEAYIAQNPAFAQSLAPLPDDPLAPTLCRTMLRAGRAAGTGPMAAVAGAIAQAVGRELRALSRAVVVENGGDLFLDTDRPMTISVGAGSSPLSGRVGLALEPEAMPTCLAASSGTVGHSLSLGQADAALVMAADGALADACATALGNRVGTRGDLAPALEWLAAVPGVGGGLVIIGDRLAAWGEITLKELGGGEAR